MELPLFGSKKATVMDKMGLITMIYGARSQGNSVYHRAV